MKKTYDPRSIEQKWSHYWEEKKLFQPSGEGDAYCIVLPPPNVTGTLHMGHGFQQTLMDALIRKHRMQGKRTLWQGGTDHAGIATQIVVEQQLMQQGLSRHDLGRNAFVKRVWNWRKQSGTTITQQIRRLGASLDWEREKFSMDKSIAHATTQAFDRLYQAGLIYRGKRLVNWDPVLKTAIADLEVHNLETQGHLYYIRYSLPDSSKAHPHLLVATTRPETLFGDTAIAVHPEDTRYQQLIGKVVHLPLTQRQIPIIADDMVDQHFGTGCVKITPAHDFNDYAVALRHDLPIKTIFNTNGSLNHNVPQSYQGLTPLKARKKVLSTLKERQLLEKCESHSHTVPHGERSGAIIEPMLTEQWFIKTTPLAQSAIDAVKTGQLKLIPDHWTKTYLQWLENIQDWCISRQLWWGHRIPVWYDAQNNQYVGENEAAIREKYHLAADLTLTQDKDVLDTWFTAALWPFSSLGWPQTTDDFKHFYPTQVLVTGFDILFFWVARMVMMGIKLTGQVPFREVYVTGLVRDSAGRKMSKSKGNTLDPIDLIDGIDLNTLIKKRTATLIQPKTADNIKKITQKCFPNGIQAHGTDALRFTFCALAIPGRNINFEMNRIEGYKHFCNKLWNAARYVLMNTSEPSLKVKAQPNTLNTIDYWMLHRLQNTINAANEYFDQYRFDLLAQTLYEFTWNEYCDWYLEFSKSTFLNNKNHDKTSVEATKWTLVHVLETLLRLLHPVMPYITEEIWQKIVKHDNSSLMLQPYPCYNNTKNNTSDFKTIEWIKQLIIKVRTLRSEIKISPAKRIHLLLDKGDASDHKRINTYIFLIKDLTSANTITWYDSENAMPPSAKTVLNHLDLYIPLSGLIDKENELKRLEKTISQHEKEQKKVKQKLENPYFIDKAPTHIIEQERKKSGTLEDTLQKLKRHQEQIKSLP